LRSKIHSLAYTDNIILLIEEEKSLIERMERYMDEKELELNVEKTEIRFKKGGESKID